MKQGKKAVAWLLIASMLTSVQGFPIPAFAAQTEEQVNETGVAEESKEPLATDSNATVETEQERIDVVLPLQPIEHSEWDEDPYIYWNPGNEITVELEAVDSATSSNVAVRNLSAATPSTATPSDAQEMAEGKDSADGLLPSRPVKSLSAAVRKAKKLADQLDMEAEDITIYAMNPMEIHEGEAYFLDGKGVTIMAWDGRDYDSDLIFYVNGGQLTLEDVTLQPMGGVGMEADTSVVQVDAGKVQIGEEVELAGAITLNYQDVKEVPEWLLEEEEKESEAQNEKEEGSEGALLATPSEVRLKIDLAATPSEAEEERDRFEKANLESQTPIIELLKDFENNGPYYLDVKADADLSSAELVRTLYADDLTADEFMEQFLFSNMTDIRWEMEVFQEEEGTVRKMKSTAVPAAETATDSDSSEEIFLEDEEVGRDSLTKKRLVARLGEGELIYWNPGEAITVNGISYPEGNDSSGGGADSPVKTWGQALTYAKERNGTIISIQALQLDADGEAQEYLGIEESFAEGTYHLDGNSEAGIYVRSVSGTAVFIVEPGICVEFSDLVFTGERDYGLDGAQAVETTGGKIVLKENVRTETAYLQIGLTQKYNRDEIPVEVWSDDVEVTLYFAGINNNLNKRFLDVVVPGGELAALAETEPNSVGEILLENISLAQGNQNSGDDSYQWSLRQDSLLDDEIENAQNLELYTTYYYEAVYLDGERGDDSYLGASCEYPVKTWERAVQILTQAMKENVEARKESSESGTDDLPPLPDTIYICGTVTITDSQSWNLPVYYDYDGTSEVSVEIVSHTEIPMNTEGQPVHALPKKLVSVKGTGASLTLGNGIFVRNITNEQDSTTIEVLDGAVLNLEGNAILSGEAFDGTGSTQGFHVTANYDSVTGETLASAAGVQVNLSENWTGAIENRGIGVYASGTDTVIDMAGGFVRKNKSYQGYRSEEESMLGGGFGGGIVCSQKARLYMHGGEISENVSSSGGAGVWIINNSSFDMKKGTIQENQASGYATQRAAGAGVLIEGDSSFVMGEPNGEDNNCIVSKNIIDTVFDDNYSTLTGAGIAVGNVTTSGTIDANSFVLYSGTISQNQIKDVKNTSGYQGGGGIWFHGDSLTVSGGLIEGNQTERGFGGGIYVQNVNSLNISNTILKENTSRLSGGGIYIGNPREKCEINDVDIIGNHSGSDAGGIYVDDGSTNPIIRNSKINNNTADGKAGGAYISASTSSDAGVKIYNVCINGNEAQGDGGGCIFGGRVYAQNLECSQNSSSDGDGGGIYLDNSYESAQVYLQDTKITGNKACNGGGICNERGTIQFSETEEGMSSFNANTASRYGGGLYSTSVYGTASCYIALSGEIQNTADLQGNNVYLVGGNIYILSGTWKQPEVDSETFNESDVPIYNIYLERQAGDDGKVYIDPAKVSIENSSNPDEEPNAIYLNSPDSYLTYLSAPGDSMYSLPITLNRETFSVGSTVARPVGNTTIKIEEIPGFEENTQNSKISAQVENAYQYTCTTASDPQSGEGNYHEGSITPFRTELGGFTENGLTDLVLVGQGIYLDGEGGNNNNSGLSPEEAVKDFATAKTRLNTQVETANKEEDGEGFAPFIYICGPVTVEKEEQWDLEHNKAPYLNSQYEKFEKKEGREPELAQVKRFASFINRPLITIKNNGTITADTLIVNGMKDAVITSEQRNLSPVFRIEGGTLNLNGNAVVRDNYYNLINMDGGFLNLDGEGAADGFNQLEIRGAGGYGVYAVNGTTISMKNHANVYLEDADMGDKVLPYNDPSTVYESELSTIGVILAAGSHMVMENSHIYQKNLESADIKNGIGIVMGTMKGDEAEQTLVMKGDSTISQLQYGINLRPYGANITLEDQSSIYNTYYVISSSPIDNSWGSLGNIEICLKDSATMKNSTYGIFLSDYTRYVSDFNIKDEQSHIYISLEDQASLSEIGSDAIWLTNFVYTQINMTESSCIKNSRYRGIYATDFDYADKVINLKGSASISYNGKPDSSSQPEFYSGIYASHDSAGDHVLKVNMEDKSQIANNAGGGIIVSRSATCDINMQGSSSISANNQRGMTKGGGIIFHGSGTLTMKDESRIENNKKVGIAQYGVAESVKMNILDHSLVQENTTASANGTEIEIEYARSELHLGGQAQIGAKDLSKETDSIKLQCPLYLEGTATVNGRIYMQNSDTPIVMTKLADDGEDGKYQLHLAESFVGQNVVIPQSGDTRYPDEAAVAAVTDVTGQLAYFVKAAGDGLAGDEERVLRDQGVNIVLSGENNVYLSGTGDDENNGLTPATAVRTFHRAKELLEGGENGGYFESGANILIAQGVIVKKGDEEWKFDEDGMVENEQSGDRWKPVLKKYEGFTGSYTSAREEKVGHLIAVFGPEWGSEYAEELTLKNIVIEDSSFEGNNNGCGILYVDSGSVILEEGAVIKNVHGISKSQALFEVQSDSSFELKGGSIEYCSAIGGTSNFMNVHAGGSLQIADGTIRNNSTSDSKSRSSKLITVNGKCVISGGIIESNTTDFAMISVVGGELLMSGGAIQNNQNELATVHIRDGNASVTGGNLSNNINGTDELKRGGTIYYMGDNGTLEISGGTISDNTTVANSGKAIGKYSPVYVDGPNFKLKGGGAIIKDAIYLANRETPITLSGQIYQYDRSYTVYVNQSEESPFVPGSVVVQPDNVWLSDATPYLGNFNVIAAPYILDQGQSDRHTGNGNTELKENQCLLLMKSVFVDGDNGSDSNSGMNPQIAVKTFEQAKRIGSAKIEGQTADTNDYYVIYASGPVYTQETAQWTLPETAYLCRYTGFTVYDENGTPVGQEGTRGYVNELIKIQDGSNLTLGSAEEAFQIFGRRGIDPNSYNGDSLLEVGKGGSLTVVDAILSRNNNTGVEGDDYYDALTGQGGAIRVEEEGNLRIEGGTITNTEATSGAAVYTAGAVALDHSPVIQGDIYLAKRQESTEVETTTRIQVTADYAPGSYEEGAEGTKLSVHVEDDFDGRVMVQYPDGSVPSAEEMEYYQLEDYILSVYDFLQNPEDPSQLTLQKRQVYFLDGENGSDEKDGLTPDTALKTLEALYQKLAGNQKTAGAVVYVVNGVTIDKNVTLTNYIYRTQEEDGISRVYKGSYQSGDTTYPVQTQVTFMRYLRPEDADTTEGFKNAQTCTGALFMVQESGSLSLNGIYLDGGLNGATYLLEESSGNSLTAEACTDGAGPLVSVKGEQAALTLAQVTDEQIRVAGDSPDRAIKIKTTLRNNQNQYAKTGTEYELGTLDGKTVYEGSSAGVEILDQASCTLDYTEFSNLSLGAEGTQSVTGGTDVYSDGTLHIKSLVYFTGSVFLEGQGDEETGQETSRFLTMDQYGTNWETPFKLQMRDPYQGRTMVCYPENGPDIVVENTIGYYILEESLNDYFRLGVRENDKKTYELVPPPAVYINGQSGSDTYSGEGRELGSSPESAVKTLKKAYELMQNRSVNILYVVDTVEIGEGEEINLTNTSYYDQTMTEGGKITLQNHLDEVQIRRYVKPETTKDGYGVESFEGDVLFRVQNGGILTLTAEEDYKISVDGHKNPRQNPQESELYRTKEGASTVAPLIEVMDGGNVNLVGNVNLHDNKNITGEETGGLFGFFKTTADGIDGGALSNHGTLVFEGAHLTDNEARKGSGIYQDGNFTIRGDQPEGLVDQEIYLTTEQTGTEEEPMWGEDHVITSEVWLEDSFAEHALELNMDHAVKGRHVVEYNGYSEVDPQYKVYSLGETVPDELFLVQSPDAGEDNILELQNWTVLDVEVPEEIFLAIQKDRNGVSVWNGAANSAELTSPEYRIVNHSPYGVKVSLTGFKDASDEVGVDLQQYAPISLVSTKQEATGNNQLYLAIQGSAQEGAEGFGQLAETALAHMETEGENITEMGILSSGQEGRFQFKAQASEEFLEAYMDSEFPLEGSGDMEEIRKEHYRTIEKGTEQAKANHARAMYRMTYRLEMVPPRRDHTGNEDSGQ